MKNGFVSKCVVPDNKIQILFLVVLLAAYGFTSGPSLVSGQEKESDRFEWQQQDIPENARWRLGAPKGDFDLPGFVDLEFSHSGNLLAIKDHRHRIHFLNLKEKKLQSIAESKDVKRVAFAPDDSAIIVLSTRGVSTWLTQTGKLGDSLGVSANHVAAQLDRPGFVITRSQKSVSYPWPLPNDKSGRTIPTGLVGSRAGSRAINHNGTLSLFSDGKSYELHDLQKGVHKPLKIKSRLRLVKLSNDRTMMNVLPNQSTIELWDLDNPSRFVLEGNTNYIDADFSRDGRFIYAIDRKMQVVIWDLTTLQIAAVFSGHLDRINAITASPEFLCMATCSSGTRDRSVVFWDVNKVLFPEIEMDADFTLSEVLKDLGSKNVGPSLQATNKLYRHLDADPKLAGLLIAELDLKRPNLVAEQLIKELDDKNFQVREKATRRLSGMVNDIRGRLLDVRKQCSSEAEWRIDKILETKTSKSYFASFEGRRAIRILLALELAGSPSAKKALANLQASHEDPRIRQKAADILKRLNRKQ